jgi:hypothetical protein
LLALSELVRWQVGVAVPFIVATAVKLVDVALVTRSGEPSTAQPAVMRSSVAAVRAQQRSGATARPSTTARASGEVRAPGPHAPPLAPSLAARERNRRVARGVAAVPSSARLRPRLSRGDGARVIGAWPMPVGSPIDIEAGVVVDGAVAEGHDRAVAKSGTAWLGPTVGIATDDSRTPTSGERGRGRNQGRFAARR